MTTVPARAVPTWLLAVLGAVVFLANAGLLVLQLVAPRYLAPFIGSSVETWTSVIGVFLAGIAIGNHFGGRLADRSPATRTLAILLALGGASALLLIFWGNITLSSGFDRSLPLGPRIPILAALFCLPPAIILSLMTPLTIKLMLPDVSKAGRVAGLVFALSTVGCLVGNYATGFWFMADYSLDSITIGVAIGLFVLAVPMALVGYRLAPATLAKVSANAQPVEDPLGFQKDIRRAYAVVFMASFCGMSLELTASRLLAPIVGWSLFTWTGIIGVMLAGTACGNYLGGVLADRGTKVAVQRFAILMGVLVGFAAGPAFVRTLLISGYPGEDTTAAWMFRFLGALTGCGAVLGVIRITETSGKRWLPMAAAGGAIGFAVAHPVYRSILSILHGMGTIAEDPLGPLDRANETKIDVTSIIVHLVMAAIGAGIAVGLTYDPKAEKKSATRSASLGFCLFGAALFTGLVVIVLGMTQRANLGLYGVLFGRDLVWNVLTITFLVFFLPMLCLGTISPQVIRLSISDTARAGRTAGTIYAWSTAGAIVGTFAAGYLLIDLLGMSRVVFMLATVLVAMAVVIGRFWTSMSLLFAGSIVCAIGLVGMFAIGYSAGKYTAESKYYAINVTGDESPSDRRIRALALDHLRHSEVDLDNPYWLYYPHEYIQGEVVLHADVRSSKPAEVLIIGGGGYTFPRFVDTFVPRAHVDVVEIDPAVTEVAHTHLGLARDTRIKSYHMDGRQFVREKAKKQHYDVVIQDAVNDLSVPWHLMTKEYNESIKETLSANGVYLLTIIDSIKDGEFWRAAVNTMRASFKYVEILDPSNFPTNKDGEIDGRHVYVIYGADHPIPLAEIVATAKEWDGRRAVALKMAGLASLFELTGVRIAGQWLEDRPAYSHVLDRPRLDKHVSAGKKIVLTDQYAPTDNLMADVFRRR